MIILKKQLIGKIVNTHGLKGELKVLASTDFKEERYGQGNPLYINFNDDFVEVRVKKYRIHKGYDLLTLVGLEDINLVEKYKGHDLYSNDEPIDLIPDVEFHVDDLVGLEVYQGNQLVGKVESVKEFPQGDYLEVIKLDQSRGYVPFRDEFVLSVDQKSLRIDIVEMEGLL